MRRTLAFKALGEATRISQHLIAVTIVAEKIGQTERSRCPRIAFLARVSLCYLENLLGFG